MLLAVGCTSRSNGENTTELTQTPDITSTPTHIPTHAITETTPQDDEPHKQHAASENGFTSNYVSKIFQTTGSVSFEVHVNGRQFWAQGRSINGNKYFRMQNIAFILHGTRAQFDFIDTGYSISIIRMGGVGGVNQPRFRDADWSSTGYHKAFPQQATVSVGIQADGVSTGFEIFEINGIDYFLLDDFAAILGFAVEYIADGIILINTFEAEISEYGRRVTNKFLSQKPTLFTRVWNDEVLAATTPIFQQRYGGGGYLYPIAFRMHDLITTEYRIF